MSEEAVQQMLLLDAAEQTYLQAINDCLQGNTAAADAALAVLGCTQRLSAAIWQAAASPDDTPQQQQQPQEEPRHSPVAVCDSPLPPQLLSALQAAFDGSADSSSSSSSSSSRRSDFWRLHGYDELDTPFSSYLIDLTAAADKVAAAAAAAGSSAAVGPACQQQPPNALELSALLLQQHISQLALSAAAAAKSAAAAAAEAARRATHVEWWVHTRPPWAPHQLHFDAAEGAFRHGLREYRLLHPAMSSVVYLTGIGGPTVVLEQDSRGATDWQQQQQQQEGSQSPHSGVAGQPPHKRSKTAAQQPADAEAMADYRHHQHQQSQQQHQQQQQQQQRRPLLARHGSCIHPLAGRVAVWPGNLLHGVLPGGRIPLETDATAAAGGGGGAAAQGTTAAAAVGADLAGAVRTTLMLAWWEGDPRQLAAAHHKGAAGPAEGQPSDPNPPSPALPAAAAAGKEEEEDVPGRQLCPCMPMPDTHPVTSSDTPSWIQALALKPQQQLLQLLPAVQGSPDLSSSSTTAWHLLPSVSPAWEHVSRTAAEGVRQDQQQQQQVELPCLRLFLRSDRDIRAAYIPALDDWLLGGAPAAATAADVPPVQ